MEIANQEVLQQDNSIITLEQLSELAYPVIIKRASDSYPSRQYTISLENEFRMTNVLREVMGIRKAIDYNASDNMAALVLEYVEGANLKDYLTHDTLDLQSKLEIAIELARILGDIVQMISSSKKFRTYLMK